MIRIFTDTAANLPKKLTKKHGIRVIPLHYYIDGKEYTEDTEQEFDGKSFYDAMRKNADITTSMTNVHDFCDAFAETLQAGEDIIYVGISSGISGTVNAAEQALELLRADYPGRKMAAIDTKGASLGEGLPVLYAAKFVEDGCSFEEVVAKTTENTEKMCQYFTVEDLKYLRKGGRISKMTAIVGNMLSIKPLLMGDNGKIVLFDKIRGRKKALEALAAKYKELVGDFHFPVGIAHADSEEDAEKLTQMLKKIGFVGDLLSVCYEPVTGAHVGPGTMALFFYKNK